MTRLLAKIFVVSLGKTYTISNNLLSIQFSGQDRSDPYLPSWGIKSNSGVLEMYDTKGEVQHLISEGLIWDPLIEIHFENDYRQERLGGFYIIDASHDKRTQKVKIMFQDELVSWQQKPMPKYTNSYAQEIFLGDVLDSITSSAGVSLHYETSAKNFLKTRYKVNFPYIEAGSLWAQVDTICKASSCYVYCDESGTPTIHYGGGT